MKKILHVAVREFVSTAISKAFVIGAFIVPGVMVAVMAILFPLLLNQDAPEVRGTLTVIDRSGRVVDEIRERLRPEAIAARNRKAAGEVIEKVQQAVGDVGGGRVGEALTTGIEGELAKVPKIDVERLAPDSDAEAAKAPLRESTGTSGGRLALAVIDAHAIHKPASTAEFGGFELFVKSKLDDRVESEIRRAIRDGIRHQRILAADLDPDGIDALIDVKAPRTREVTDTGERAALGEARQFVSFGFMAVLMISVMMGGQYLLTTTVEEKSSRVVEVLLSALSPMQLMAGKILGQLCVGLTILVIYSSVGGGALLLFGLADLLGASNLIYMMVFFLIAYVTVGAMTAAIGSSVSDLREAQSLQGPVMIILIIPYMLWFPISRDPNSIFATVISFLPPVSPFVMMLRITSIEPPPLWEILLSMLVGVIGVVVAVWAAAKIFRIGLLMFGKPPNLVTLLRWVRQA